jgi:AcrR family transcriptional regulator
MLERAGEILRDGGLASLNLRGLSRKTGIALGSVYHHFYSKGDLLGALAVRGFEELQRRLRTAVEEAQTRRLGACIRAYFEFARGEPSLYALMFDNQVARFEPVCRERSVIPLIFEDVIAATPEGQPRPRDLVHSVGTAIWACVHGAAIMATPDADGDQLIEATIIGLEVLVKAAREKEIYPNDVQAD